MSGAAERILLTGGTGFLGSHLAARLLTEGHAVDLLSRAERRNGPPAVAPEDPASGASARSRSEDRALQVLAWHGLSGKELRTLRVIEGELTLPGLGLAARERDRLREETVEIIHCASVTSFADRARPFLEEVNLRGLERLLDLASETRRLRVFHYISTAYVAGMRRGICPEEPSISEHGFHNGYEETKCLAEHTVRHRCREMGVRCVIHRPSVVTGHSRTGRSLAFQAVYVPVRAAWLLRDIYLEDLRERQGRRSAQAGVFLREDGTLHLPLRVAAEGPGIDLVPVDFFSAAFAAIRATADQDFEIHHIVSGRPTPAADLASWVCRLFRVSGVETVAPDDPCLSRRNPLEAAFDRLTQVYRPYLSDLRRFTCERTGPVLDRAGVACPPFTYDVFRSCMEYALANGWGQPLPEGRACR